MLSIYKYKIYETYTEINDDIVEWLDVGWQDKEQCFIVWALVNVDSNKKKSFLIRSVETGELLSNTKLEGYKYLGSVNLNIYVSHFFVTEI